MNQRRGKAIVKYLERYAEPNSSVLLEILDNRNVPAQQAVVIPAYDEGEHFVERLAALPCPNQPVLTILILNGPQDISASKAKQTLAPLALLKKQFQPIECSTPGVYAFQLQQHIFVCVDLIEHRPAHWNHFGVGYARKLGMDMCLWLYHKHKLDSPFVRTTDADVIWPNNYLQPLPFDSNTSAVIYPFQHGPVNSKDPAQCQAAHLYDAWLRYYVEGLRWAGSPWAFHTIGSTLAIHLQHYANCRGFPKREAGEDFYLLNKLAKTGAIKSLSNPVLQLSNRESQRTPFGTGSSILKIRENTIDSWRFYHPDIFRQLKHWYQCQSNHFGESQINLEAGAEPIQQGLINLGMEQQLQHCQRNGHDQEQFNRQMNHKLDASLTRKLVHRLRDQYYPSLSFAELIQQIQRNQVPFIQGNNTISTPEDLSHFLQGLTGKALNKNHEKLT